MAITKTGKVLSSMPSVRKAQLRGLGMAVSKDITFPLNAGFGAMQFMSGDRSLGGVIGSTVAGGALGSSLAHIANRSARRLLGKNKVSRIISPIAGLVGGTIGWSAGEGIGDTVGNALIPFKRPTI